MALPFDPKPFLDHQTNWRNALRRVFDPDSIAIGASKRPGEIREHVLDFPTGLRIIVSREDHGRGIVFHLTASVWPNTSCGDQVRSALHQHGGQAALYEIQKVVVETLIRMDGSKDWWHVPVYFRLPSAILEMIVHEDQLVDT